MKYLQRFNESIENKDIKDYILMCFAEFSDDNKYEFEHDGYDEESYLLPDQNCIIALLINTQEDTTLDVKGEVSINIEETLKNIEETKEFYLDIDSCIKKVKDEYPDIDYDIVKIRDEIVYLIITFKFKMK